MIKAKFAKLKLLSNVPCIRYHMDVNFCGVEIFMDFTVLYCIVGFFSRYVNSANFADVAHS